MRARPSLPIWRPQRLRRARFLAGFNSDAHRRRHLGIGHGAIGVRHDGPLSSPTGGAFDRAMTLRREWLLEG